MEIERSAMGELMIDFSTFGWFPDNLPSEAAELDEDDQSEQDADQGT